MGRGTILHIWTTICIREHHHCTLVFSQNTLGMLWHIKSLGYACHFFVIDQNTGWGNTGRVCGVIPDECVSTFEWVCGPILTGIWYLIHLTLSLTDKCVQKPAHYLKMSIIWTFPPNKGRSPLFRQVSDSISHRKIKIQEKKNIQWKKIIEKVFFFFLKKKKKWVFFFFFFFVINFVLD